MVGCALSNILDAVPVGNSPFQTGPPASRWLGNIPLIQGPMVLQLCEILNFPIMRHPGGSSACSLPSTTPGKMLIHGKFPPGCPPRVPPPIFWIFIHISVHGHYFIGWLKYCVHKNVWIKIWKLLLYTEHTMCSLEFDAQLKVNFSWLVPICGHDTTSRSWNHFWWQSNGQSLWLCRNTSHKLGPRWSVSTLFFILPCASYLDHTLGQCATHGDRKCQGHSSSCAPRLM